MSEAMKPLGTELRDPGTTGLDAVGAEGVLRLLNAADASVAGAVEPVLPELARVVDHAVAVLRGGGSVHYFGAGTSGRMAVLDAAELRPTFDLEPGRFVAHIAGGADAVTAAVENAEDDEEAGLADAAELGAGDLAFGVAASGRTPYVAGALRAARAAGARTVLLANVPEPVLAHLADHVLAVVTGPEVLTGSTRLKAGTAAKLVLNGFSTATMVGLGRTWSNLMVSLVATNEKLRVRTVGILREITGLDEEVAREVLQANGGDLRRTLVAVLGEADPDQARAVLADADGSVRAALALLRR